VAAQGVVLTRERIALRERIDRRTEAMFAADVIEEVREVGAIGPTASQTLGWREIRAVIEGNKTREESILEIQQATRRYAKRQLTWFRREPHLERIEIAGDTIPPELIERLGRKASETM
jgi:tRNA dimethylallyltransferase